MTASLAFRKNEAAIYRGDAPVKYTRLLPFIPRGRILEIGSAEGVLALLLAQRGDEVTALERAKERHEGAIRLRDEWLRQGFLAGSGTTRHIHGDAGDYVDLLSPGAFDALIAVRMIYYLGGELNTVFSKIAKKINTVVLCGNRNRADAWRAGRPHAPLGEMNRYAASEGMAELLVRHGYEIVDEVPDGDEIVVGRR